MENRFWTPLNCCFRQHWPQHSHLSFLKMDRSCPHEQAKNFLLLKIWSHQHTRKLPQLMQSLHKCSSPDQGATKAPFSFWIKRCCNPTNYVFVKFDPNASSGFEQKQIFKITCVYNWTSMYALLELDLPPASMPTLQSWFDGRSRRQHEIGILLRRTESSIEYQSIYE